MSSAFPSEKSLVVINRALLLVGDAPVDSLDDTTAGAGLEASKAAYPLIAETALARHPWRFATKVITLREEGAGAYAPSRGAFKYSYLLPGDYLSAQMMRDKTGIRAPQSLSYGTGQNYEVYGDHLATDEEDPQLEYTARVTENHWPKHFEVAVTYDLCAAIAIAVTGDARLPQGYAQQAERLYLMAIKIDNQARPPVAPPIDELTLTRAS